VDMRGFIGSKITPLSLAISNMNTNKKTMKNSYVNKQTTFSYKNMTINKKEKNFIYLFNNYH
ncbi:hypothetical protein ACVGWD_04305, partial [Enterobacter asburiae]